MNVTTAEDVRGFLKNHISEKLRAQGRDPQIELPDDCDLLLSGLIDSVGLLELMTAIQDFCGREIDFETLDPEQMTIVGPLCRFVSAQIGGG